jgi:hypothetical protein
MRCIGFLSETLFEHFNFFSHSNEPAEYLALVGFIDFQHLFERFHFAALQVDLVNDAD